MRTAQTIVFTSNTASIIHAPGPEIWMRERENGLFARQTGQKCCKVHSLRGQRVVETSGRSAWNIIMNWAGIPELDLQANPLSGSQCPRCSLNSTRSARTALEECLLGTTAIGCCHFSQAAHFLRTWLCDLLRERLIFNLTARRALFMSH